MKKTLLLTSILLGLHSAANAKNEFFVGASVNASNDRYNIDKGHRKAARIGINGEAIKSAEASKQATDNAIKQHANTIEKNQNNINQVNFAVQNKDELDLFYVNFVNLETANGITYEAFEAIASNPHTTFEEKQNQVKKLIQEQGIALMQISNSLVNPMTEQMVSLVTMPAIPGVKPQSFYTQFLNQVSNATTVAELHNAFTASQAAATNVLNFIETHGVMEYMESVLTTSYANAGYEFLSLADYQNAVLETEATIAAYQAIIDKLEVANVELEEQLVAIQAQLDALITNKQNVIKELNSIETTASEINTTVSLFAGFRMDLAKHFMLGFEAGTDLGNIKIGDNSKKELEIRGGTGFYALTRMGVNFSNLTVYGQAGLMTRKYDMSYNGTFIKESNGGQNITSAIYGLGMEARISNNVAVFTEYNRISSIDKLETTMIKASLKSDQIKVGSRYYFGL